MNELPCHNDTCKKKLEEKNLSNSKINIAFSTSYLVAIIYRKDNLLQIIYADIVRRENVIF